MTDICAACGHDVQDGKGHGLGVCVDDGPTDSDGDITNAELNALMAEADRQAKALSLPPRTIACEDVQEDDFIYDSPPKAGKLGSWMRVTSVDPPDGKDNVWIHGTRWSTCGHRRQGIAVKRARWEDR